jgi:tetratricopeptide (TPR) repeat protein
MRNPKAAVAAYDRLDQRFGQETDPAIRTIIADALFKKGETLTGQGDTRAAVTAFEEIDRRYASDRDAGFRLRAVRALFAKGTLLGRQGAGEEPGSEPPSVGIRTTGDTIAAVAVYDDIVKRFGRENDPNIRNIVGATLLKKSEALRLVGDDQGTIAVYGEIVERFGNDNVQISRVLVATALFRKGLALGKLEGASPAATGAFDEVIRRFANDTHPNMRKIVGQAVTARQRLIAEAEPMHDN